MKNNAFFNGWDLIAVGITVVAAVLVIQYSLARGGKPPVREHPVVIQARVPRPIPQVMERVSAGDAILDSRGHVAGRILSMQWTDPIGDYEKHRWSGKQDVLIKFLLEGEIPLVRDEPAFSHSPANLKAGIWCLITTDQVELSALIQNVEPLPSTRSEPRTPK